MEMFLLILPVLVLSVVVHEYAHGWVALREGDATALASGRLTLNPVPHLDLFGSFVVPLVLWLSPVGFLFGWAKPVPVDPRNFRNYRRGDILVSLAGIAANMVLAVAFTAAATLVVLVAGATPGPVAGTALMVLRFGVLINLVLAFFNLLPIPPLDGSHVVYHLLPAGVAARYRSVGRYGLLVLVALLYFAPQLVRAALWPVFVLQGVADAVIGAAA